MTLYYSLSQQLDVSVPLENVKYREHRRHNVLSLGSCYDS